MKPIPPSQNPSKEQGFTFLSGPDFTPDERVRSAYHFYADDAFMSDTVPAVGGQFALRSLGSSVLQYPDGTSTGASAGDCYFNAPSTMACEAHLHGPAQLIGLGFSELGWAELTGLRVDKVKNTIIPAKEVLGHDVTDFAEAMFAKLASGEFSPTQVAQKMIAFVQPHFKPLKDRRKHLIQATRAWATDTLQPDVHELYDALPYSHRQVQRMVMQYFGQTPTQVAKRLRAAFTASVMSHDTVTPEVDAEIGESYFDQSHLIRDVKATTGRTPGRLAKGKKSLLSEILNPDGFLHDSAHTKKAGKGGEDPPQVAKRYGRKTALK